MAILALTPPFLLLIFLIRVVHGRILRLSSISSNDLISDGIDQSPFLRTMNHKLQSSDACQHIYGFFPCSDNMGGYIFQAVVYQYLLMVGERLMNRGSKVLFNIRGTGIFGGVVFPILMVFPRMVLMIVSGVVSSKENAESQVSFGVGSYAGSTVFNLTLHWGLCVICGNREFTNKSPQVQDTQASATTCCWLPKEKISALKDTGITIDKKTTYTARIMLLSLIPYIIVQLVTISKTSSQNHMVILIALIVSPVSVVSYFTFQVLYPWIQDRSLQYSKYENLLSGFLDHVQRHAKGKLIDRNGEPNLLAIRRLFLETDKDDNKSITSNELEHLVLDMLSGTGNIDKDFAISEVLKAFDLNNDGTISEGEFIAGCKKWIEEARRSRKKGDSTSQEVQPFTTRRMEEFTKIERLMSKVLRHAQDQALEYLVNDDGSPNDEHIRTLFGKFDSDENKWISESELRQLLVTVKFGELQIDVDDAVKKLTREFDQDGDNKIDEQEFIEGFKKWIKEAIAVTDCEDKRMAVEEYDKIKWKEVDKLVYEESLEWALGKSVTEVILGIAMLTFLGRPLMVSILQISEALSIPSFFTSFVIVPFAMNARMALSAMFPAGRKSKKTASLTFSEIYGGVIMTNITGLTTLLAIVYAKDLSWDYSAEVLLIMVVSAIIGLLASLRLTYPLWTCIMAISLYPFSLGLYYVVLFVWGWN